MSMDESRTKKSIKNVSVAMAMQIVNMVVGLVSRTIFIKLLGNDYLSVNGLFTNILTLLSFAELGIGNAIIFALYKPIAQKDEQKICQVLNLYKKAFRYIAKAIIVLGIVVIPFLGYLVKDVPDIKENIILIYGIFLFSTASTYFFSYRNALIIADQKNYIISIIKEIFSILRIFLQVTFLLITKNYIGYLLIEICVSLTSNIFCYQYAKKKYPFLTHYNKEELPKSEKDNILRDVKSLFVYKGGAAVLNGTDNIIIAVLLKIEFVGLCSNYSMVVSTLSGLLMQACSSITASIGNHNVVAEPKEREKVFRELNALSFFIFAFSAVCLAVLLNELIFVWLGADYLLDQMVVIAMVLTFLLTGMNQIPSTYRMTLGLFRKASFIPLLAAIINIILSLALGRIWGLFGVFIATSIAKLLTFSLFDPILIYRKGLETSAKRYYFTFFVRLVVVAVSYFASISIVGWINIDGIIGLFVKTATCVLSTSVILIVYLIFDKDFKKAVKTVLNSVKKRMVHN